MEYNLRIPQDKRYLFAEPLDFLIAGSRKDTISQVENIFKDQLKSGRKFNFYITGDIVANDFLSNPFLRNYVKLCIIDEKTQRNHINLKFEDFFERTVEFQNPEGTINKEFWIIIREIIKSEEKSLIKIIKGEEDLLVLPLVLEIPILEEEKNFAFYGQPPITDSKLMIPEGIVIVDVDENTKEKVKKVISLMEKF
ncbi:MAG: DUF359 domain-containing protein [Promethearchaeota archaeon]